MWRGQDWHIYTNPTDMFNKRKEFDGKTPQNSNFIFASGGVLAMGLLSAAAGAAAAERLW